MGGFRSVALQTKLRLQLVNAVNGTDLDAAGRIKVPLTFQTGVRIDDVDLVSFANGVCGTLGFTGAAIDACLVNVHRHNRPPDCKR
jgi:hypothetical protein